MQTILIILLFLGAVGYMASRAYKTVSRRDTGCGKGCGCSPDSKPGGV
ncbi:MAG: FeoB-associated Cys-rich membrane protein [Bacteroidetes bacterium]|nr:FeoB-associated Cys-rich membrane protein [Fibrella sp.]